ncbi:xanthine dehydrogenase accessory factor [Proteiniborus ethanoligenes]|uniref:Xanthine dehydrogenase accessory factor n=1 Tax=Proteiniborus ethanoligenes TaxID=415015 RepID=A0A1H3NG97_9FIRM|nr:XdhC/CoxI family protein [Proteiniborus ethanoligenes]SDY87952.1 xanthine dehydrogenase accessory factor [Proteiniborus ethanoligenes]
MEQKVLEKITEQIKENKSVALATIINVEGSIPGKKGGMMAVFKDGTTFGTVGGGKVELLTINSAKACIESGESKLFSFGLNDEPGGIQMQCGGRVEVFIKVFIPEHRLIIVGGGHLGHSLYKLGKFLNFHTVIFDEREEYCCVERFPDADELYPGNIEEGLKNYNIDENCYIIIVTHGHKYDELALKAVLDRGAKYIGMVGSVKKTKHIMDVMRSLGIPKETLETVYSPVGIDLGGQSPQDIALGIMAEIILVKNNGRLEHTKNTRKVDIV